MHYDYDDWVQAVMSGSLWSAIGYLGARDEGEQIDEYGTLCD